MSSHQSREAWAELLAADPAQAARRVASLRGEERREAEDLLRLSARLTTTFEPVEPDAAFVHRVGVALRARPRRAAWLTPGRRWALAAAATVGTVASVAGVVAVLMRHRSQSAVRSRKSEA